MALKEALGFSLKPVDIEEDGTSAPPDAASFSPPSHSPDANDDDDEPGAGAARLFQATQLDPLASEGEDDDENGDADDDADDEDGPGSEQDLDGEGSTPPEQYADSEAPESKLSSRVGDSDLVRAGVPRGRAVYRVLRSVVDWLSGHKAIVLASAGSSAVACVLLLLLSPGTPPSPDQAPPPEATANDDELESEHERDDAPAADSAGSSPAPQDTASPAHTKVSKTPGNAAKPTASSRAPETSPLIDPWEEEPSLPAGACVLQGPAKKVLNSLPTGAYLEATAVPNDVSVLLGTTNAEGVALGLKVNATTLQSEVIFEQPGTRAVLGVVPDVKEGKPSFTPDRVSIGGHREWRTLPGPMSIALTRTNRGVHLIRPQDHRTISLWPVDSNLPISRPQVARYHNTRFAVAFRRGLADGDIVLGWVDTRTLRRSGLNDLPFDGRHVGVPSLAQRDGRAVVAAAVQRDADQPWTVGLTTGRWKRPSRRVAFNGPPAPKGVNRVLPAIVAVSRDRWLLQWTEQSENRSEIFAQTLDSSFAPLGDVVQVSPNAQPAEGGVLTPVDQGLLSLFVVSTQQGRELWGATMACD